MTMTNITKILSNLRRKHIDNKNALVCPDCGYEVDLDYMYDDITDGNIYLYWEHETEETNTNGETVLIKKMRNHPKDIYHVPKYVDISTFCRSRNTDGEEECWKDFTVRYYITAQEIIS